MNTPDTLQTRLDTIRAALMSALALTHAVVSSADDGNLQGSDYSTAELAEAAREALVAISNELYWIRTLGDRGGDATVLDTPIPG